MFHQTRISSLAAGALLLLSSGASAEQCPSGEQSLEFRFFTDNNSWKDNGWTLECDYEDDKRELVWSVPIASLQFQGRTEVIREAACIPDTATCYLNIFDAKGDGLQGSKNGDPSTESFAGWFAFLHGATTIGTYKNLEEPRFSELSYCVGPECDQEPEELGDEDCQDMVFLAMQLDNNPADTTYQLMCGGEDGVFDKKIIWDGKGFTKAGEYVEEETCLPKDACCEFIVVDGNSNGLTEEVDDATARGMTDGIKPMGFIYLERNNQPVLEYDGSTGETFGVLTKKFGCEGDIVEEEEEIIATEAIDIPEEEVGEELEVEVADNVEPVFDPEELIEEVAEEVADEEGLEFTSTFPPTTEDWVSDDDYQNLNDDGLGFGEWTDDFNGFLTDDVFMTQRPTLVMSDTYAPTWAPTSEGTERDAWDLFDDVVDDDDWQWGAMDDLAFPIDGQMEIDGMIQDLNDHTVKLPTDPNALKMLNGEQIYRKKGLTKNAKIIIGVLVPFFLLWTIGLLVWYFKGASESTNDKGTTGDAVSDDSLSGGSVFDNLEDFTQAGTERV